MRGGNNAVIAMGRNPEYFEHIFGTDFSRDQAYINGNAKAKTDARKQEEFIVRLLKDELSELKKKEAHIYCIDKIEGNLG